ncbi:polyadenylate-binding protein 2-like isoform X2 [Eutrema salsugineum]|uniref:polyadenylate-binding protein 2-like isoform X2 n=1 Tax=Eutrema salsugineum TaxID=72664 RepID=UPI000CED1B0C|nr:polyadenylate-binding protein 2-like isoform X2 [Eutrema salsugineum]
MDNKRKRREESDDSDALVKPKKQKKRKKQKKKIDDLSNCLNEMTKILKKLKKNSDELEISLKEKETPKKEMVEHKCLFESNDSEMKNPQTIYVKGFDCFFPIDDIKSALKNHFSSCGEVSRIFVPFECETGSPLGFAFINMRKDDKKALTLDGSYLGGLRLEVTMAKGRNGYSGYTNFNGCKRCRSNWMKRRSELERFFHRGFSRDFLIKHGLIKTVP